MAQSGFTPISLYYTTTASAAPTAGNLVAGELAINTNDGILYYKDSSGVVQSIASKAVNSGSFTNLAYTGTLTGGTGVVNLGSGQFYKDASGNVGIGTSSPATYGRLAVKQSSNAYNGGLSVIRQDTDAFLAMFYDATPSAFRIGPTYASTGVFHPLAFFTSDVERMRINAGAPILCLAGGNTTATGTGIAFPATQSASSDANTLDDYEEGTWTPTLNFGGASGVTTYGQRNGTYTKVGNVVTVRAYILITTKSAATGGASLDGLPFTTNGSSVNYASGCGYFSGQLITGSFMVYLAGAATGVQLGQSNGTTGFAALTNTNFVNSGDLIFQTTYIAA